MRTQAKATRTDSHARPAPVVATIVAVFLLGLLPLWVLFSTTSRAGDSGLLPIVLHGLISVWSGCGIVRIIFQREPRILRLVFYIFVYLWMGLAPFVQNWTGQFPLAKDYASNVRGIASAVVALGVVCFELGHFIGLRKPSARGSERERAISWSSVLLLTWLSVAMAVLIIPQFGGAGTFFVSRQALDQAGAAFQTSTDARALRGIFGALLAIPPLFGLLGWLLLFRAEPEQMKKPSRLLVLLVLLALNGVVNNPISNSRSWFSVCAVSALMLSGSFGRPKNFPLLGMALVAAVVFLFPYLSYFRFEGGRGIATPSIARQYALSGDYDAYQQICAGIAFTLTHGFDYGRQLLGPVFFFVPRSIWSGKPIDTGVLLGQYQGYAYTNLSAPIWIEFYMGFGIAGVAAAFVVIGLLWRRLDDRFVEQMRDGTVKRTALLLVVPILGLYQTAILRGSLLTVTGRLSVILAISLAVFVISRRSRGYLPDKQVG